MATSKNCSSPPPDKRSKNTRATPERLVAAAESRLRQWNITDEQIAEIERKRQPQETLTLRSPFRGVVQEVPAHQGVNVKVGDFFFQAEDGIRDGRVTGVQTCALPI